MIKNLIDLIIKGNLSEAQDTFSNIMSDKIHEAMSTVNVELFDEAIASKLVVRQGKIHRKWSTTSGSKLNVRGKQYAARSVSINPVTGKRKEIKRSEAQVRKKVINMKRRWKTTMRAKLPQLLRKRARSNKLSKNL